MSSQSIILALVVLALIGGAALLFGSQVTNQPTSPIPQNNVPVGGGPGDTTLGQVQTFNIEGRPFEYNVKEIRVKKGATVRVNFASVEGLHNWSVDEFDVRTQQLPTGQSDTVEFVADKAGTFEYYCSVGNHRQMGMVGNLIVE